MARHGEFEPVMLRYGMAWQVRRGSVVCVMSRLGTARQVWRVKVRLVLAWRGRHGLLGYVEVC